MIVVGKFTGKRIGIIGGFGAYATLDFYGRLLDSFAVESERDYPNMIIDNVYSMPSRTRALLTRGTDGGSQVYSEFHGKNAELQCRLYGYGMRYRPLFFALCL